MRDKTNWILLPKKMTRVLRNPFALNQPKSSFAYGQNNFLFDRLKFWLTQLNTNLEFWINLFVVPTKKFVWSTIKFVCPYANKDFGRFDRVSFSVCWNPIKRLQLFSSKQQYTKRDGSFCFETSNVGLSGIAMTYDPRTIDREREMGHVALIAPVSTSCRQLRTT